MKKNRSRGFINRNLNYLAVFVAVFAITFAVSFWVILPAHFGAAQNDAEMAAYACIFKCKTELISEPDLSSGPCLSNEIVPGWVCDIAHSPREEADNDPANQCPGYGITASHFVELNDTCNIIRIA